MERAHGHGYFLSSKATLLSTSATPFADGYVLAGRATLRRGLITLSGFPNGGAPMVLVLSDGPAGEVLYRIPCVGAETVSVALNIPFELENGLYAAGVAAIAGVSVAFGTFVLENREPGNSPQAGDFR